MPGDSSGDALLAKIAIFGIAISIFSTMLITILIVEDGGDYDYDSIQAYRDELGEFTGESLVNDTPWVLTSVYTPWNSDLPVDGHLDPDGWLYGQGWNSSSSDIPASIAPYLGHSANIKLDPTQKSSTPLFFDESDAVEYSYVSGVQWWADGQGILNPIEQFIGSALGQDPNIYSTGTAQQWQYTGYRYVFDPTLPFANADASSVDGSLSIVWYNYNGTEGISGGLQIYGGDVLLANYSAADIVAGYNSASPYATSYDFVFEGVPLTLSVRFDQSAIDDGMPLMQAWTQGYWSMSISSVSAGNFYDISDSISFTSTAGSMFSTFIDIFTFSVPSIDNYWMDLILWLIVALPFTLAMLLIAMRAISNIFSII